MVLWCGLKSATEYVGSGASWKVLPCIPRSATICSCLVLPDGSYEVICDWLLLVLGLWYLVEAISQANTGHNSCQAWGH